MTPANPATVTAILKRMDVDRESSYGQLLPLIMDELQRMACGYLRNERPDHTLQPTALVNEVYMRLVDQAGADFQDRIHFMAVAARSMRQILIDHARGKRAKKRGGAIQHITLDERLVSTRQDVALTALDDALGKLEQLDARKGRVIELRFFGGLTIAEAADVLKISPKTVEADWYFARAWLKRELSRDESV